MSKNVMDLIGKNEMEKLLSSVQKEYERQVEETEYYRKKYEEFRKDTEIQMLESEIKDIRRRSLLLMSEAEYSANRRFMNHHYEKCGNGNTFQYELHGTGVGIAIRVKCPVCGEQEDITDTDSW